MILDTDLSLFVSVFQVSFICVRVFAACRRTEISTDLPVRGKFDFLFLKRECGSPLYCMTRHGIHIIRLQAAVE